MALGAAVSPAKIGLERVMSAETASRSLSWRAKRWTRGTLTRKRTAPTADRVSAWGERRRLMRLSTARPRSDA